MSPLRGSRQECGSSTKVRLLLPLEGVEPLRDAWVVQGWKISYGVRRLAVRAPGKRPKTRVPILDMLIGCHAQFDAQAYQAKYAGGSVIV